MVEPFGFERSEENELFYLRLWREFENFLRSEMAELKILSLDDADVVEFEEAEELEEAILSEVTLPDNIRERLIAQLEMALVDDMGLKSYVMTLHRAIPDLYVPEIMPPEPIVDEIMQEGLSVLEDFNLLRTCFCLTIVAHLQIEIWRRVTPFWQQQYDILQIQIRDSKDQTSLN